MKKILLVTLSLISTHVIADRVTSPWFVPLQVGSDYNGPVVVFPPEGVAPGCINGIQAYPGVPDANSIENGYKGFTAIALAAFTAQKQVQIDYDNNPGCYSYQIRMK